MHPQESVDFHVKPAIAKEIHDKDTRHQQGEPNPIDREGLGGPIQLHAEPRRFGQKKRKNISPAIPISTSTFRK